MSIYLVYCARHSTDKNGLPMPQADLQINLPEQVQYRFAGYIQAVIEQYAQELEASLDEEDGGGGSDVNSNDEGGERAKKKRRRRPKKVMQEDGDEEDPLGSYLYRDCPVNSLTILHRCSSRRPRPCD
jgi:cohesin complex subunit SA-1/2